MTEDKLVGIVSILFGILLIVYAVTSAAELIDHGYMTYQLKVGREFVVSGKGAALTILGISGVAALFLYAGITRYQGKG